MGTVVNISPVTRIEGHARIAIHLDDSGNVENAYLHIQSLRGFEKFIEGRPAEEIPRIVNRVCGICPWMHHLASVKAVDAAFGITPAPAGHRLREICQVLAHIHDKILHFFFLAAPDFVLGPDSDYSVRNVMGIVKANPELARRVVKMRQLAQMMLERFAGKAIHPVAGVVGGFSKPMLESERLEMLADTRTLLDFACYGIGYAKKNVFSKYEDVIGQLGNITTGFLATVDRNDGALRLYDGQQRLMRADGTWTDFEAEDYTAYIGEHVEPWGYSKMPYAKSWNEGFSLDLANPKGIYRANTLARINVCERISTPLAQAELEQFREKFGRMAQQTLLYHYARLIEMVYACERTIELLEQPGVTDTDIRAKAEPRAGRGVGIVEAPRGTLIHDYTTDDAGCIKSANLIVGTTHNIGPMNMSVKQAAAALIKNGNYSQGLLNKVEMAVRAYDP
ncbi:Ni/Fe hydrogenase subunit alpha [Desulfopila inferna]|uniref:Ni/Fe hydrogenase subunit alpha n=1 Tax=Desulfopila inferna TaxID=468528 RepID=UPI001965F26B|nr:Ni/Fe hydrogenase subunit alpha [Desulfopila inferna]MBM9603429.1 Ni/Fe hydrogenase subunit alpha [Desulfopila inferna]